MDRSLFILICFFLTAGAACGNDTSKREANAQQDTQSGPSLRLSEASEGLRKRVPAPLLAALRSDEPVELLSLHPYDEEYDPDGWEESGFADHELFHGYAILGSMPLTGDVRTIAMEAYFGGIEANGGEVAECFEPRHGFRVRHDGRVYELVACFECLSARVYIDGKRKDSGILSVEAPRATLNAILKTARVPLPEE